MEFLGGAIRLLVQPSNHGSTLQIYKKFTNIFPACKMRYIANENGYTIIEYSKLTDNYKKDC